jgi:Xaa-Pro aminopeptidase
MQKSGGSNTLTALRDALQAAFLAGFVVPRADEHLGEYVPASAERLAFLTGFTGSAGMAVVLTQRAALFVDGRYTLQAEAETDPAHWERHHLIEDPPPAWTAGAAGKSARIGYDPWLMSEDQVARFRTAGLEMVAVEPNPIDAIWPDRPAPPASPVFAQPTAFAGRDTAEKRAEIATILRDAQEDAVILGDPASLCWLLNMRGNDVPFTPFALAFGLLRQDAGFTLFLDPARIPQELRETWGPAVTIAPRGKLPEALAGLAGRRVRVDPAGTAAWFGETLRRAGAEISAATDPCLLPKACKNPVEQAGTRNAHKRDAVAMCRFLHWLDHAPRDAGLTELSAAASLLEFRRQVVDFRGESFPAISGAGPDGAIIHYRVTEQTNRPILPNQAYLIDSGGQYPDGTTDITRTVWTGPDTPPEELRDRFTRVLQGHIAIATLRFPKGVAGPHIDVLARRALWEAGLDYDHGTGHGVGSFLSVHEGPAGISRAARPVPLDVGMILSNEPGFYLPGAYGIRLENLVLVQPDPHHAQTRPFLEFETLTLAPFDRRLILADRLTEAERGWLDAYHARVLIDIGPLLAVPEQSWLAASCAALGD